jgi:hypothetical protein
MPKWQASRKVTQVTPAPACVCHGYGRISVAGHLQNERASIREKLGITTAAELISYAARWSETQA